MQLSPSEMDIWINPEVVALAVRHHLNPVAFLLNAPEITERLDRGQSSIVIDGQKTIERAKAYKAQIKRIAKVNFRFSANLSYSRFDTLSPSVVPGSVGLLDPRQDAESMGCKQLLPRHLMMAKDGNIAIDDMLDLGKYSCGCPPSSEEHKAKLDPRTPREMSKSGTTWMTSRGIVVFAPQWLLPHMLEKYLSGDMSALLAKARESLLKVITPDNPGRAVGRLFHSDRAAMAGLSIPTPESREEMFQRFSQIRLDDGVLSDIFGFDLSNPQTVSICAELSYDFLPAGFMWFMKSLDASFLLEVAGYAELAKRGDNDLSILNVIIYQCIMSQINPLARVASKRHTSALANHLLMIVYSHSTKDLKDEGGDIFIEEAAVACLALLKQFAGNMTRLAFRYAIEGAGILATLGNPPYPVAAWSSKWLFTQWKRFAYSNGIRQMKAMFKDLRRVKRVRRMSKAERLCMTADGFTLGEAVDGLVDPLSDDDCR